VDEHVALLNTALADRHRIEREFGTGGTAVRLTSRMSVTARDRILVTVMAFLALPWLADAQSPDFSGEWTRVDSTSDQRSVAAVGDAAFRVGTMGAGWGSPLTLRQQGGQLVVEYTFFSTYDLQPRLRFVYALDGSEARNTIMIGHSESVLRSRATWRDSTLVITTIYPAPGGATEVTQSLTLSSPTSLIMETTRSGVAGSRPTVTRTTYAKR
jgi:hypothetical protein